MISTSENTHTQPRQAGKTILGGDSTEKKREREKNREREREFSLAATRD